MTQKTRTALALAGEIRKGKCSVRETVQETLKKIRTLDGDVGAFLAVAPEEELLAKADSIQKRIDSGSLTGPLAGVPVAVKDNICTKGLTTTCASRILENFIPPYSADAVERLEAAGALVIGKTNMDEFAMGSTTETSAFRVTRNPRNPEHVPGGSSGGSCAAVAAGEVLLALGSDTGGSIRQPSAFCGVTGLKPTYGTVSRYGLIAYASSLDQIGPVAGNVSDCAALLEIIAGHDPKDATSLQRRDCEFTAACVADVRGMKIGIPEAYLQEGLDPEVRQAILRAAETFRSLGAEVETFELPLTEYAIPAYYLIASAEASSNLARFDGVKYGYRSPEGEGLHEMYKRSRSEGFGPEVKRRIMLGSFVLSAGYYDAYYLKALRTRALIRESYTRAFRTYDLLLAPAYPTTAPKLGVSLDDPLKMYLGDIHTVSVNLAGLPAISIPCGADSRGLPIGMQLIGDAFMEKKILRAAFTYEQAAGAEAAEKKEA